MATRKKTKWFENPKLPRITNIAFVVFLSVLTLSSIILILVGSLAGNIDASWAILFSVLFGLFMVSCFALVYIQLTQAKKATQMRFDPKIFKTVKNAKSEPQFLENLSNISDFDLNHGAVVSFSIYKMKKDAISQLGYKMGSEVPALVFAVVEENLSEIPDSFYGYDFNENFLLYIRYTREDDINPVLERLKQEIKKRLEKNNLQIGRDFAYGVYFHVEPNITPEEMLRRSLIACDFGNFNERGGVVVYDKQTLENAGTNDLPLYEEIIRGMQNHEFELFYQPKYDLNLDRFFSAEALIRWRHPKKGLLSPAAFIPFAEQSELIISIDRYVFEMACQDIASWKIKGERLLPISVNLSRKSIFKTDLIEFMKNTIDKYKVNPLLLEMEITESATAKDNLFILSVLKQIQGLNIQVAIDDFGTGYSSMSSLKRMPVNSIKIDKSFLDDIEVDAKAREVVKAIIKLAHALEMKAVAEGIQSKKQVQILKEQLACDAIQGYYYSRPLPNDEYVIFIKKNRFERKTF